MSAEPFVGCDSLREWLADQGFRVAYDRLRREFNDCNWYAFRRSSMTARECECNEGKRMQIVVKPHRFRHESAPDGAWESVEVSVTGEAESAWYELKCYSVKEPELRERLAEIERRLIAAWNALA